MSERIDLEAIKAIIRRNQDPNDENETLFVTDEVLALITELEATRAQLAAAEERAGKAESDRDLYKECSKQEFTRFCRADRLRRALKTSWFKWYHKTAEKAEKELRDRLNDALERVEKAEAMYDVRIKRTVEMEQRAEKAEMDRAALRRFFEILDAELPGVLEEVDGWLESGVDEDTFTPLVHRFMKWAQNDDDNHAADTIAEAEERAEKAERERDAALERERVCREMLRYGGVGEKYPFERLTYLIATERTRCRNADDRLYWATLERKIHETWAALSPTQQKEEGNV